MAAQTFKKDFQYIKFCAYGFLKNLRFFEIFIMVFLLGKLENNFSKVGTLYSTLLITRAILEIPSGVIADSFGRKGSIILSYSLYIGSFIIFYFSETFGLLFIPVILYGLGDSFRTGTHKAMIFDYLLKHRWESHKTRYYGHTRSWSKIGSAFSVAGATLIKLLYNDFDIVFLYSTIPYVIGIILLASYPAYLDGDFTNKGSIKSRLHGSLSSALTSLKQWKNSKQIFSLSYFFGFHRALKDYIQPIIISSALTLPLNSTFQPEEQNTIILGALYFLIFILSSIASRNAYRISELSKGSISAINILASIGIISGILIALFVYSKLYILSGLLFIVLFITIDLQRPNVVSFLSESYDKNIMATVLSVESQVSSITGAFLAFFIGLLSDIYSIAFAIGVVSILSLIIVTVFKVKKT